MTKKTLEIIKNNKVNIVGEVISNFEFSYEFYGEKFYHFYVSISRLSEINDVIPVVISDRIIDVSKDLTGKDVEVIGDYRSYNSRKNGKMKLLLYVFTHEIHVLNKSIEVSENNKIFLDGFICKKPIYRKTPLGREITDLLLAVNRPYSDLTDYIPCICWNKNARYAQGLKVGYNIKLEGRIQSREYQKYIASKDMHETKVAYEISVKNFEILSMWNHKLYNIPIWHTVFTKQRRMEEN